MIGDLLRNTTDCTIVMWRVWFHTLPVKKFQWLFSQTMCFINSISILCNTPGEALHISEGSVVLQTIPEISDVATKCKDGQTYKILYYYSRSAMFHTQCIIWRTGKLTTQHVIFELHSINTVRPKLQPSSFQSWPASFKVGRPVLKQAGPIHDWWR